MKIIWLGHGSFRIEIEDQVLLIDPWLTGNPMLSEDQHAAATQGATHILITHGHFDHTADLVACPMGYEGKGLFTYETGAVFIESHQGYDLFTVPRG